MCWESHGEFGVGVMSSESERRSELHDSGTPPFDACAAVPPSPEYKLPGTVSQREFGLIGSDMYDKADFTALQFWYRATAKRWTYSPVLLHRLSTVTEARSTPFK